MRTTTLAGQLLDRADARPGLRILDVTRDQGTLGAVAERRGAEVVAADGTAVFGDDTFDLAVSMDGLAPFPGVTSGLRELARVIRPGGRVLVAALGAPDQAELLTFGLGALQAVVPDLAWPSSGLPTAPLRLADLDVMRRRFDEVGLTDVRAEAVTWEVHVASAAEFWELVTQRRPLGVQLTGRLTGRQLGDVTHVLDGMFRERSGGAPGALLRTVVNLGSGSVPIRRSDEPNAPTTPATDRPTPPGDRTRTETSTRR